MAAAVPKDVTPAAKQTENCKHEGKGVTDQGTGVKADTETDSDDPSKVPVNKPQAKPKRKVADSVTKDDMKKKRDADTDDPTDDDAMPEAKTKDKKKKNKSKKSDDKKKSHKKHKEPKESSKRSRKDTGRKKQLPDEDTISPCYNSLCTLWSLCVYKSRRSAAMQIPVCFILCCFAASFVRVGVLD